MDTVVVECEPHSEKVSGKNVNGYNIILEDSVLFPEGGGQVSGLSRHVLSATNSLSVLDVSKDLIIFFILYSQLLFIVCSQMTEEL